VIARIAIDGAASGRLFDYAVPPELAGSCAVGARVRVHFGRRAVLGYVAELVEESDFLTAANANQTPVQAPTDLLLDVAPEPQKPALKPVEAVDGDAPVVLPVLMRLARWMAQYYLAPVERCIQTLLPAPVRSGKSREKIRLYVEAAPISGGPGFVRADTDAKSECGRDDARPSQSSESPTSQKQPAGLDHGWFGAALHFFWGPHIMPW
jgi:primosomal protein N'